VKSSNPTQDNDGNALVSGALYFSDSANEMRVYDGANWIAATSAGNVSLILYEYTAGSGQTTFSGSDVNSATLSYTVDNLQVVMNGVILDPSDYTATNGTSVVLAAGAATGDLINIYAFKSFTTADMVSKTNGGTFAGAVTFDAGANFGDNDKAQFGAGNDLQIYHTGGSSFVADVGTGNLTLLADEFRLNNSGNTENMITATPDGAVTLFHNDSAKVATSSTGVDVTGDLEADGINIGTSSSVGSLTISEDTTDLASFAVPAQSNSLRIRHTSGGQMRFGMTTSHALSLMTNAVDRLTVTASGNVGIGTSSPAATSSTYKNLQVALGATVIGRTDDTPLYLSSNLSYNSGWKYIANTSATQIALGTNIQFFSVPSGTAGNAATLTERMRIDSSGRLGVGKTPDSSIGTVGFEANPSGQTLLTTTGQDVLFVNRKNNDGLLVRFFQDGSEEGNISVSGSTVSYNGGHLSRWSQATDGNRIDGLVKGTVMTNLDQMAVWHHEAQAATYYTEDDEMPDGVSVGDEKTPAADAYDEDNEQLNCMAVSSVEGDANVAGVFVNWDDDDTDFTSDMNVAMTGDMVIRIAQGTTVARGDLLMSAGDGTAKPQGDDIVRSKTIAKVTSTTVSHTYDDGSYLVPCVLMAC
jgi:hypothetical protein